MLLKDLEEKIIQNINESNLPIDAVYFVMKSIMQEVNDKYFDLCQNEKKGEEENGQNKEC